jgi:hypothetical protein
MRRALVLSPAVATAWLLSIFGPVPPSVSAAPPSLALGEVAPSASVEFHFHREGYLVFVDTEGLRGRLALTVARGGDSATYLTHARPKGHAVKARFGRLGSVDLTFVPSPGRTHRCDSIVRSEGVFKGDFEFTGEHHYIHFAIGRIAGEFTSAGSCSSDRDTASGSAARHVEGTETDSATLLARTRGPSPLETFTALGERSAMSFEGVVAGFRWENREGMEIVRGAQIGIGGARFAWNLATGTATVRPPSPFTGSATFRRRRGGPDWSGTLRVPILGGRPMSLTGSRFQVHLHAGAPGLARTVGVGSGVFQLP